MNGEIDPNSIDFSLQTLAMEVTALVVEGEDSKLHDFYARRENNNFGKYFDAADITRCDPCVTGDLLRTVPGATIGASTWIGNRVLLDERPVGSDTGGAVEMKKPPGNRGLLHLLLIADS